MVTLCVYIPSTSPDLLHHFGGGFYRLIQQFWCRYMSQLCCLHCFCLTQSVLKLQGKELLMHAVTPPPLLSSIQQQKKRLKKRACKAFHEAVETCLAHTQLPCYPGHTNTHLHLNTREFEHVKSGRVECFMAGYYSFYFQCHFSQLAPHLSSPSSSLSFSHAETIKSGHSFLLFRSLQTDERSQSFSSEQWPLCPIVVPPFSRQLSSFQLNF